MHQLCVPEGRRQEILHLAHDQAGFHQGQRKTSERIRLNFYWPLLKSSVVQYVLQCPDCQLTKGKRVKDRVPTVPILGLRSLVNMCLLKL